METIGTLINNLKTKFDEQASNNVLLQIAQAIIAELENERGLYNKENIFSIPTLAYQSAYTAASAKNIIIIPDEIKIETNEPQEEKSLNDILKEDKTEISQTLESTPVQDLRQAIGINDRFVFINGLFAGKDDLYEQSIKTLNRINNLSEADNWMARELKTKLNWDNNSQAVQQFYKLVKRKFSS